MHNGSQALVGFIINLSTGLGFVTWDRCRLSGWLVAGTAPILEKTLRECMGQMKIFHVGAHQFQESLRELLGALWFSYCSSREMPF